MWFRMRGKLALIYIGPIKIVQRIDPVAYRLALPSYLSKMDDVFHVSLHQKDEVDPTRVLPLILLEIKENLTL